MMTVMKRKKFLWETMGNYSVYKELLSMDSVPINEAENIRNTLEWPVNSTVLKSIFNTQTSDRAKY